MEPHIDLSKLTSQQLSELKAAVKAARTASIYKSLTKEICDLPPDKAKEVLCKMARDVEEKSIGGGWQKIVLNAIKYQM